MNFNGSTLSNVTKLTKENMAFWQTIYRHSPTVYINPRQYISTIRVCSSPMVPVFVSKYQIFTHPKWNFHFKQNTKKNTLN